VGFLFCVDFKFDLGKREMECRYYFQEGFYMEKNKYVNIDPKAKPGKDSASGSEQEQQDTAEANMKLQEAFYDDNDNHGIDPANLNNQSAILTKE
jgi:hypothetical protein